MSRPERCREGHSFGKWDFNLNSALFPFKEEEVRTQDSEVKVVELECCTDWRLGVETTPVTPAFGVLRREGHHEVKLTCKFQRSRAPAVS